MTQLLWDLGTAYDFFLSLDVLHSPDDYDLPGAWTAGVRARLPTAEREILEQSRILFHPPLHWIYTLPKPKDAAAVIWTLGQVPPAERLPLLTLSPGGELDQIADVLKTIAGRGAWDEKDREAVHACYQKHYMAKKERSPSVDDLNTILNWWARSDEFGERYLKALRAYQDVFFAEEENRIQPALQEALARAQELAKKLPLPDLLEELSQGLQLAEPLKVAELVLAPSYWITPLVYFGKINSQCHIWAFGARPANASLVPGEVVPDTMVRTLKALSDPTRLRILQYIAEEPVTAADLARRLRLRTPTVLHHLQILRVAGLVHITLSEDKDLKTYAARPGAVATTFAALNSFIEKK